MKIVFDGMIKDVTKDKGVKVKQLHERDYIELENGVWIKGVGDGSYYDDNDCLWLQAYVLEEYEHEDEEYQRVEATGLYYKVGY